jgi:hypothetical protein
LIKEKDESYSDGDTKSQWKFYDRVIQNLTECKCNSICVPNKGMFIEYQNDNGTKKNRFEYKNSDFTLIGRQKEIS